MTAKDKLTAIFNRKSSGQIGFWAGNPHGDTMKLYRDKHGFRDKEELYQKLHDDFRWLPADSGYKHPEGKAALDPWLGQERKSLSQPGCLADAETVSDVEKYPWPDPDYLDFTGVLAELDKHPDKLIASGMWSPFFHQASDFLGMENYFIKMHTHPAVVEAVTEKIVSFYEEANSRFFRAAGERADVFFFGNDFGSQQDLLISPGAFNKFVLPYFQRLIKIAKKYNKLVLLHSCGSIHRVIPSLIESGIDGLHPLQAKAAGMEAEKLAKDFKGKVAFVGGVDTQELLVKASPAEIKDEVKRLNDLLGPDLVVSPSHEAVLPNIPYENLAAMSGAVREINGD